MINWQYFFGTTYNRYYKAFIDGVRVEQHYTRHGVKYAIGNIDEAEQTYDSEEELVNQIKQYAKQKKKDP